MSVAVSITAEDLVEYVKTHPSCKVRVSTPYGYALILNIGTSGEKPCLCINGTLTVSETQKLHKKIRGGFEWVQAKDLKPGDYVEVINPGSVIQILTIERAGSHKVYDLTVANDTHSYLTSSGYHLHNCQTYSLFDYFNQNHRDWVFNYQYIPLCNDHKMISVVRRNCRGGVPVNFEYAWYAVKDFLYKIQLLDKRIRSVVGNADYNSPKVLSGILFDDLKIPVPEGAVKNKTGFYSVDEDMLNSLYEKYPDIGLLTDIVQYRKFQMTMSKLFIKALCNSYVDRLQPYTHGRVGYNLTNVPTGRMSSSSGKGMSAMVAKKSKTTGKVTVSPEYGDGAFGINSQGVGSDPLMLTEGRRLTAFPPGFGIDLENPYSEQVESQFIFEVAACKVSGNKK